MSDSSVDNSNAVEFKVAAADFVELAKDASSGNDKQTARMYFGLAIGLYEKAKDRAGAMLAREIADSVK